MVRKQEENQTTLERMKEHMEKNGKQYYQKVQQRTKEILSRDKGKEDKY